MMQESIDQNIDDNRRIRQAMLARMWSCALHNIDSIDIRNLRAVQDLNLIEGEFPSIGNDVDLDVLRNLQHERRQEIPEGPFLLYRNIGKESKRKIIELPLLFMSDKLVIRQAVMDCFEKLLARNSLFLTRRTECILREGRDSLLSDVTENWLPASISIFDALNDDIFIALHGLQQALAITPVIPGSLSSYVPRILYPNTASLDSIQSQIGCITKDSENLDKIIASIVLNASNLSELCDSYLSDLGFLPLSSLYCMGAAVKKWLALNKPSNVWDEVWTWSNSKSTPLSQYHACVIFVLLPDLIPEGKLAELWGKILLVTQHSNSDESYDVESEEWKIRRTFLRHYTSQLEAHSPGGDGASIGCTAWWLAEIVSTSIATSNGEAKFYMENWVKPASEMSMHIWLTACAPIQRSYLRYITFMIPSPWAVSLLVLIGESLGKLKPAQQAEDIKEKFHSVLVSNIISSIPFPIEKPAGKTIFAPENSLNDTIINWLVCVGNKHQESLKYLTETNKTLGTSEGLCDALRKIIDSTIPDQYIIALVLKANAFSNQSVVDDIWNIVSDREWRMNTLCKVDNTIRNLMIECFSLFVVENGGKWASHIPHYIAELCENEGDPEEKRTLFHFTIQTSLASNTVSAIQRLLRGEQRAEYIDYIEEYRNRIGAILPDYPLWVQGKLRSLMASMHVR